MWEESQRGRGREGISPWKKLINYLGNAGARGKI